jgi:hypothetical protein
MKAVEGRMTKALNMVEAACDEDIHYCGIEYFTP